MSADALRSLVVSAHRSTAVTAKAATADACFQTLGIPIVAGRPFDGQDVDGAPPVLAINQALACAYFWSEDPVGWAHPP